MRRIRCAIYTRKSSEDGLEQEFNSLHAQREACASYVASQKHEGWQLLQEQYNDGGLSGGSLERPALQQLIADIRDGKVDQIVVYKIDRLTRSLADFAKIVDVLDAAGASFVSVTQSFNTATSMGRLTLNMLLSFAQFEREVTAERIRDKIDASKRKGLWMGGSVPLGYAPEGRTLKIVEEEAQTVRALFDLYEEHGTIREVAAESERRNLRNKVRRGVDGTLTGGNLFDRGRIHYILTNPVYAGRIRHRRKVHDGQHQPIIEPGRWDRIQQLLQSTNGRARGQSTSITTSLLCGKLFDETGDRLTPSHTKTRAGKRLRYYISHRLIARSGEAHADAWRLQAGDLEARVVDLVRAALARREFAAAIVPGAEAASISNYCSKLEATLAAEGSDRLLALVERIDISAGLLRLKLDRAHLATALAVEPDRIDGERLVSTHPFHLRRRGVETRIVLADDNPTKDDALICNIARAHVWFERLRAGESFDQIAASAGTTKRRIQQMSDLAFLAPDIVRDVLAGSQPSGFTSDWCKRHGLPSAWAEQRARLATL